MTTINEQNAKQIRKPMEVYVRMDLSDKSITMTYSGYSSAKIADGKLDQTDWKMRKLTDLQGDGYPLDSSCVLYNPNTTASASNGKIGVRGDIGQPVSVTITGSDVMDSVSISVTGASAVTHDGSTSTISGGTSIISVEATTTTLTFTPKSADRRVEISDILPGVVFNVTNETMISCTLSLRADLSIVDPTLPESEMNLEFYNDEDISEVLAAIPEDTPITYRAGYDGDLSPERKFYIADQVTYKDNVVSVHAVDAVHFLIDFEDNVLLGAKNQFDLPEAPSLNTVADIIECVMAWSNVSFTNLIYSSPEDPAASQQTAYISRGASGRDLIAFINNVFHLQDMGPYGSSDHYWLTYVDAGIPKATSRMQTSGGKILEEDCADVARNIEKPIGSVSTEYDDASFPFADLDPVKSQIQVGTLRANKGQANFVELDGLAITWMIGFPGKNLPDLGENMAFYPSGSDGAPFGLTPWAEYGDSSILGNYLADSETLQRLTSWYWQNGTLYTQVIPNNARYADTHYLLPTSTSNAWTLMRNYGLVDAATDSVDVPILGHAVNVEKTDLTVTKDATEDHVVVSPPFSGKVFLATEQGGPIAATAWPDKCLESLMQRSNKTGSFTWKGDPRMQPRDVFTFVKLDGTEIDCTIEQIDLEHVGGGTTAKITYREGIV